MTDQGAPGQTLSRDKSDILLLVDIVSAESDKVRLIAEDELRDRFLERAATAPCPSVDSLKGEIARSADERFREKLRAADPHDVVHLRPKGHRDDGDLPPTTREQRKVLTRRELLTGLLTGETVSAAVAASEPEPERREVTEEDFRAALGKALAGEYGLARLVSWDKVTYYHYRPLLSRSYARMLSARNNPVEQLRDAVRESSRVYPRPMALACFEEVPYSFSPERIEEILQALHEDPDSQDIRFTQTSIGTVFLYSTRYLEDEYADFLAEQIDVGMDESP